MIISLTTLTGLCFSILKFMWFLNYSVKKMSFFMGDLGLNTDLNFPKPLNQVHNYLEWAFSINVGSEERVLFGLSVFVPTNAIWFT